MCPMWDILYPPIGMAYLASYLEKKDISVDALDINIEIYNKSDENIKALWKFENYNLWTREDLFREIKNILQNDIDRYVNEIIKKNYKIVSFSLYGSNILFSIELASALKKANPNLYIIFGGPSCSFFTDHHNLPMRFMHSSLTGRNLLEPGLVDAFVAGEGEETFLNLVESFFTKKVGSVPGSLQYANSGYSKFSQRTLIGDLNTIPYPAWEKLPLNSYLNNRILPILFSRGCVNNCSFCNDWKIWMGKYRYRSALNIFEEIKTNLNRFKVNNFICNDLMFNGNLKTLDELTGYIIDSKLDINWTAQGAIKKDITVDFLKKLRKSGFTSVTYGVESLSENVLDKMRKRYTFADIKNNLIKTKKAGINTYINLVIGFPNEREEDFDVTKRRLRSIRRYLSGVSSLNPCYITAEADLEKFPQDFSLYLPDKEYDSQWVSREYANDYNVRKRRVRDIYNFAKKIGLNVLFVGIYDGDGSIKSSSRRPSNIFKFAMLCILFNITLFYTFYFWLVEKTRNKHFFK